MNLFYDFEITPTKKMFGKYVGVVKEIALCFVMLFFACLVLFAYSRSNFSFSDIFV